MKNLPDKSLSVFKTMRSTLSQDEEVGCAISVSGQCGRVVRRTSTRSSAKDESSLLQIGPMNTEAERSIGGRRRHAFRLKKKKKTPDLKNNICEQYSADQKKWASFFCEHKHLVEFEVAHVSASKNRIDHTESPHE